MAKSKAKSAKKGKNKAASKPKVTVEAVEAKASKKDEVVEETTVVDEERDDEEKVVEETEEVVEEDNEKTEEESEEVEETEDDAEEDTEEDSEDEESEEETDDEESDEDDSEEEEEKTPSKKEKKAAKKAEKKAKKEVKETVAANVVTVKKEGFFSKFFARKCDANENILTIFKDSRIFGAIIAEIVGTGLITAITLTLGLSNPLYVVFGYIAATLVAFKLSGANLNPLVTAGMLATRRMSAIRGILYFIAQALGAWGAFAIINAFAGAGATESASAAALPALDALAFDGDVNFWAIAMLEFFGATVIAFAFARALSYKKNEASFAITVATGVFTALLFAVIISGSYLGVTGNSFVLNPATAIVYGVFPSSAEGFDALMSALMPMLVAYVIMPVLGGIIGFFVSDCAAVLAEEDIKE